MLSSYKDFNEIIGQTIRVISPAVLTAVKAVPMANTGGSNVKPILIMPIKLEHAAIIAKAKTHE